MFNEHDYRKVHLVSYFSSGKDARYPRQTSKDISFPVLFEHPTIGGDDDMYRFIGRTLMRLTEYRFHVTEPFCPDEYLKEFYPKYIGESDFKKMLVEHKRSELAECSIADFSVGSIRIETRNLFKSRGVLNYWEKESMFLNHLRVVESERYYEQFNPNRVVIGKLDPASHTEFTCGDPVMRMESYAFEARQKNDRYILPGFITYETSKLIVNEAGNLFLGVRPHPDIDPENIEITAMVHLKLLRVSLDDCVYTYFKEWEHENRE